MADCSDQNENPTCKSTSSNSDGENHFYDFDSDDTDADPNFTDSSSESSESSSSDLESAERTVNSKEAKKFLVKEKFYFLVMQRIKLEKERGIFKNGKKMNANS